MPRVLISGYYGFDNLGDDTVLYGILTSMRKERPDVEFAVLSNQPERTARLFGIPAFNRWNGWIICRQLLRSDLLIMGGGTLLQDVTSPRSILYYLGIVCLAKLVKKPVVFFAQGFGPVNRPISKRLIAKFVNQVDLITVRDDKSRDDFLTYISKPPIEVTADPALSIDPGSFPVETGQAILSEFGVSAGSDAGHRRIGVAIRNWSTDSPYHERLAAVLDILARQGHTIIFIPMQYPRDVAASKKVADFMQETSILLDRQFTYHEVSTIIASLDLVIGMRLHSLILASVFEVPFVSLSYDPKIDRFVQRMGFQPAGGVDALDQDLLLKQALETLADLSGIRERMSAQVQQLRAEAEKSAVLAAKFLSP
ncbi:MAG: polysaccharide pyruvyl transferase CsaB [Bacilli bacterium]|nr:polysaccharide pyruvyl transferase CsaB [Bacilli bacterium]